MKPRKNLNDRGHSGPADDDWTIKSTLSGREMELFDFPTEANLDNTAEATTGSIMHAYPNPAANSQRYSIQANDSMLLKLVVMLIKSPVLFPSFRLHLLPQLMKKYGTEIRT